MNICAIARNEGLYIREWVIFHRIVGVEQITVYNNNSDDDTADILKSLDVEVIEWPMPRPSQQPAYQHYLNNHHSPEWTAFIDIDEFLWSPSFLTIQDAINSIPVTSAIGVNWVCFGSGGRQKWSPEPVIERFTWRAALTNPVNQHIKSIIRTDANASVGSDPHFFHVPSGTFDELGAGIGGPLTASHSSTILRINHYSAKSYEEWIKRAKLGKPDRAGDDIDPAWYWDRQQMDVDDRLIHHYLPALKERLA